jgi:hypothetical protein
MTSISDTEVVNAPGGLVELGYSVAPDTTVTATTIGSAHQLGSITFVSDGSPVLVEFSAGVVSPPTNNSSLVFVALEVDGSTTNRIYWISFRNSASAGNYLDQSAYAQERLVLSAGTHTIRTLAWCSGGTNGVVHSGGNYSPAITRVSKILQASQLLVTQSNAPIVTSLPSGNLVTGQEVDLYVTSPYVGYQRYKWNGSAWYMIGDSRGAEWQSFTPGLANITLGNGTLTGRYTVYGKRVNYIGQLNWGSTTSASGYFVVNLPTNAFGSIITGSVQMVDGGTRAWTGSCAPWSAGQFYIVHTESGNFGGVNQSNPFTWGSGDYFSWSLTYEMA